MDDKDIIYEEGNAKYVLQKYESADYEEVSPKLAREYKLQANKSANQSRRDGRRFNPREAIFDVGKERNTGNQFWKQGKGRQEHKEKEMAAK